MACTRCQELAVEFQIRAPSDLKSAIRVARDNIADNTIREVASNSVRDKRAFTEVTTDAPYDDVLNYQFECCSCAQKFMLTVETYHGSGGRWQPC